MGMLDFNINSLTDSVFEYILGKRANKFLSSTAQQSISNAKCKV